MIGATIVTEIEIGTMTVVGTGMIGRIMEGKDIAMTTVMMIIVPNGGTNVYMCLA